MARLGKRFVPRIYLKPKSFFKDNWKAFKIEGIVRAEGKVMEWVFTLADCAGNVDECTLHELQVCGFCDEIPFHVQYENIYLVKIKTIPGAPHRFYLCKTF